MSPNLPQAPSLPQNQDHALTRFPEAASGVAIRAFPLKAWYGTAYYLFYVNGQVDCTRGVWSLDAFRTEMSTLS
jgi:hypothetical protein